jgi:hypothetical protein
MPVHPCCEFFDSAKGTTMTGWTRKPRGAWTFMGVTAAVCASIAGAPEAWASDATAPLPDIYATERAWSESKPGRISAFVGWAFNIPFGSARDFTKYASLLGFELQCNAWLTRNLSLGVSGEWAAYTASLPRTTYSLERAQITAKAYNELQMTSLRLLVHYNLPGEGPFQPYIGPHLGVSWSAFELDVANLALSDTQFSINLGGEVGVVIPFEGGAPAALFNLRYSTAPAAEFRNVVSDVQSLGLLLGIGF